MRAQLVLDHNRRRGGNVVRAVSAQDDEIDVARIHTGRVQSLPASYACAYNILTILHS